MTWRQFNDKKMLSCNSIFIFHSFVKISEKDRERLANHPEKRKHHLTRVRESTIFQFNQPRLLRALAQRDAATRADRPAPTRTATIAKIISKCKNETKEKRILICRSACSFANQNIIMLFKLKIVNNIQKEVVKDNNEHNPSPKFQL